MVERSISADGDTYVAPFDRLFSPAGFTIRDLDIDSFADGVLAHRNGKGFHENPHGPSAQTVARLSWHIGWNERALATRD